MRNQDMKFARLNESVCVRHSKGDRAFINIISHQIERRGILQMLSNASAGKICRIFTVFTISKGKEQNGK